ncbi:unnamed protein product [Blepharisma stoltei]|uniref:Uncharacterized protein n=1 Tax=Blepharisma stoltei TaxID=1481888 RepID=A0AAU9K8F5_9CILI|nr:unnamed protein product [Blepharisma stoltei]
MGCAKSQTISNDLKMPKQEQALIHAENSLLISRTPFLDFYKEIKLNSSHKLIKRSQLERSLSQAPAGLKSEIMQLCEEFHIKEKQYNSLKICIAIILLGSGNNYEKMKILYHLIDEDALEFINNEQLRNSLENLIEIATENIPHFIKDKISPLINVSEYLEFIKKEKSELINKISNELMKGHNKVREAEFCEKLCQDKYFSPIMNASKVRILLHDMMYQHIEPSKLGHKINENNLEKNAVKSKLDKSHLKDTAQKLNFIENTENEVNKKNREKSTFICQAKPIISICQFEHENNIIVSNKSKTSELKVVVFSSGSSDCSLSESSSASLPHSEEAKDEFLKYEDKFNLHPSYSKRELEKEETIELPQRNYINSSHHFDTLRPPSSQDITYGSHRNSLDIPFYNPRMSMATPSIESSDMDIDFGSIQPKPRSSTQWAPIKPIITNASVKSTTPAGKYSVNSAIKVISSVPKEPLWKSNSAKTSPAKHRSSITNSQQSTPKSFTLRVNVGPGKYENVTVGPNDDLLRVGQHFAATHGLKLRDRDKLIRDLKMLKDKS